MTHYSQHKEHESDHASHDSMHCCHDGSSEKSHRERKRRESDYLLPMSVLISAILLTGAWIYTEGLRTVSSRIQSTPEISDARQAEVAKLEEQVIPADGITLPVRWGDFGAKLVEAGVIDEDKFKSLYEQRGGFPAEYEKLLSGTNNGNLRITRENSGYVLNLLWAFGLGNKNIILETGEMMDERYGGNPGGFASTGGWILAKGDPMNHYSKHAFAVLTSEQQALVERISRGIFRPCCNNSTHFPDCNHGMAMLGLLELMASQGMSEQDMWNAALAVNSYWFPDTYITIASYMKERGVEWKSVDPRTVLSADYSSASGYRNIASQVIQPTSASQGANGCGVGGGVPVPQRQQSGCGI